MVLSLCHVVIRGGKTKVQRIFLIYKNVYFDGEKKAPEGANNGMVCRWRGRLHPRLNQKGGLGPMNSNSTPSTKPVIDSAQMTL
ncbi:MAG: hypothetical protein WC247_13940, partial [Porticoccaceae bacterium]